LEIEIHSICSLFSAHASSKNSSVAMAMQLFFESPGHKLTHAFGSQVRIFGRISISKWYNYDPGGVHFSITLATGLIVRK